MDCDKIQSLPPLVPLHDGVRAVLENARFEVHPISESQNRALPVRVDYEASSRGCRYLVKCVSNPDTFEADDFRKLIEYCHRHKVGVMIISDGFFSTSLTAAAQELSVQLTDQKAYRNSLAKLPLSLQQSLVTTETKLHAAKPVSDEPLPPLSFPLEFHTKPRRKGLGIGLIVAAVALLSVIGICCAKSFGKLKRNYVIAKTNTEKQAEPSLPVDEVIRNAMVETRKRAGFEKTAIGKNHALVNMIASSSGIPADQSLRDMQGLINPALKIGSSALFEADDINSLVTQVKTWQPLADPGDQVEFGNVAAPGPNGKVWTWVYSGNNLSQKQQLDEALTGGGIFSMNCRHCQVDSTYKLTAHAKHLVAPICSNCGLVAHMFGPDTEGDYRRACDFLTGFKIPDFNVVKHRPARFFTPKEDVMAHWQAILDRCDYEFDSAGRDVWKLPEQTWNERLGDCEDTTILLTDALISAGYEARVAFGFWQGGGHAWCVVKLEDRQYILESTMFHTGAVGLRSIIKVGSEYIARGAFDRDSIYLRLNAAHLSTLDYFSNNYWMTLDVNGKNAIAEVAKIDIGTP